MGAEPRARGQDAAPLVQRERRDLADLFDQVGPDAPTLCTGWSTRDLAAHLVLREGHPSALGIALTPVSRWTEHTRRRLAGGDYRLLVDRFRQGPPLLSFMRLPGADSSFNTFEHVVHHEDVRRAGERWQPRELSAGDQRELWSRLDRLGRWYLRATPLPVQLDATEFGSMRIGANGDGARDRDSGRDSADVVTISGEPLELVLHLHGRRDHSVVDITGSDAAVERWASHRLEV